MTSLRWLVCLLPLFVAACHDDDEPLNTGGRQTILPSIEAAAINTSGGEAGTLAGRSGGGAGAITLAVQGGRLLLDDGDLPAQVSNFLTNNELDGNIVTYDELLALQTPVVVGTTATFTITGVQFYTFPALVLDLTGAPAGTVDTVAFLCDEMIRLDGPVRLRRTGADAVNLVLSTIGSAPVVIAGLVDAVGAATFAGGSLNVSAGGGFWLRGVVDARGGAADDANDGGAGGNVTVSAGGDFRLRGGSLVARGGNGEAAGSGGAVSVDVTGASGGAFNWGVDTRGGLATSGTGGDGGGVTVSLDGRVVFFLAVYCDGGVSQSGDGGNGGAILIAAPSCTGLLELRANGGNAIAAAAGQAGSVQVSCGDCDRLTIHAWARGGQGDTGRHGGSCTLQAERSVRDCKVEATLHGGGSPNAAGNGGTLMLQGTGPTLTVVNCVMRAFARGGGGANSGLGGGIRVDGNVFGTSVHTWALAISGDLTGGNGSLGGAGGFIEIEAPAGSVHALVEGDVSAGTSSVATGGAGGEVSILLDNGSIDAHVDVIALGGAGIGTGGNGGSLVLSSAEGGSSGGDCVVSGEFVGHGAAGDALGGDGGSAYLRAGDIGTVLASAFFVYLNGGPGPDGGLGGQFFVDAESSVNLLSGSMEALGGAGTAGAGGAGGGIDLHSANGTVIFNTRLSVNGGSGTSAGGNGGYVWVLTDSDGAGDAGDIFAQGPVFARGGSGGTGVGGLGGWAGLNAVAAAGADGDVNVYGNVTLTGGGGATAGDGGIFELRGLAMARLAAIVSVGGFAGGEIFVGVGTDLPLGILIASNARLLADGTGAGPAGFITLDAQGTAPNPALILESGATLSTRDGNGTDQSATNQVLD